MGGLVNEDETAAPDDVVALDMLAALAASEEDLVETPEAFLTGVSVALKASDEVDADLATILSDHLLTATPHADVIANAKAAILTLAATRAAPAKEQAHG